MPIYEYVCGDCGSNFELRRSYSVADDPAGCPSCTSGEGRRKLSLFASFSKSSDGAMTSVAGGGGCSGCAGTSCATCH